MTNASDRRLSLHLTSHDVSSSFSRRWQGLPDRTLLQRCSGEIDAFVTIDANMAHQQNIAALPFGVISLRAGLGRLSDLLPLLTSIEAAASRIQPGQLIELTASG